MRLAAVLVVFASLGFAQVANAADADEIIAQHVRARGGAEALQKVKVLRREGRLVVPGFDADIRIVETRSRPGSIRQEVTLQGLTAVQAYDGKQAWQIQPFQGRKDPELMTPDDAKSLISTAYMDGMLVGYRERGSRVDYLGLEDVDGTPAHKLRLVEKDGDQYTYFIDPDTYMLIREVQKRTVRGAEQETEIDYGEYEEVAGVFVPMTEEQGAKGSNASQKQKVLYEKAAANVEVAANVFSFPAAK